MYGKNFKPKNFTDIVKQQEGEEGGAGGQMSDVRDQGMRKNFSGYDIITIATRPIFHGKRWRYFDRQLLTGMRYVFLCDFNTLSVESLF